MKFFIFLLLSFTNAIFSFSAPTQTDNHIKVDQFGYRTTDKKFSVISNPVNGYNNNVPYIPGNNFQVRRWADDSVVFSGTLITWNGGSVHSQSGDKVWWFDFSELNIPGIYYVYDVSNNKSSYQFEINDMIYRSALLQTFKAFYYQRCGCSKVSPFAQTGWTDSECHTGNLQDTDCRLYNNTNPVTSKNLSGGWHDAGDYNKYVNFAFEPVMDLLLAFRDNAAVRGDDFNIPESGNGIPDILDEAKYELDWLLKMQNSNGSVNSIVGVANYGTASPPSSDNNQRLYGTASTSASLTASALFALGAIQFNSIGQTSYAALLQTASVNAYNWALANPNITFYNSGIIGAGEQETSAYEKFVRQMTAACFLYALTGNANYKTYFENNYAQIHLMQWGFAYPFESGAQNMMLYYTALPGVSSGVSSSIKNAYKNSMKTNNQDNLPALINKTDAYRSYLSNNNYTWGSNTTKGRQGIMFLNMINYKLDTLSNSLYEEAALGYLNYFNGINPTAYCYITNMSAYGAENSVNEIYHSWFEDGSALWDRAGVSVYGPAPGFIPGGVNPSYALDGCCPNGCSSYNSLCNTALVTPPLGQPIQKSYKDWNTSWPQNSWTITEPGIYTQAAYVRLISGFIDNAPSAQIKTIIQGFYDPVLKFMNMNDTVYAYLRNSTSPYAIADSARGVIDSISFTGNFNFSNAGSGTYYIVLKHRNSIETWSRAGGEVFIQGSTFTYDFTLDPAFTFGNNVISIDEIPLIYGIYNGDPDQNRIVNLDDIILIYNDASTFNSGYLKTDITGDNQIGLSDVLLSFNNSGNFVEVIKP